MRAGKLFKRNCQLVSATPDFLSVHRGEPQLQSFQLRGRRLYAPSGVTSTLRASAARFAALLSIPCCSQATVCSPASKRELQ
jgi:hypothetical protein